MADAPPVPRPAGMTARSLLPPAALHGFVLLLVLVFALSYAAGSAAGPVAPGMHGTSGSGGGGGGDDPSGTDGGMEDMPGMRHGGGE
ncbi:MULTISPECIES: hypothetical protein [Streptomyces]|uniref:hypothetical protein n=1 Tax=Streptomyces TaxID=1883 RepID=UPI00240D3557|nr:MULTISPECIES: hypothetical protein [Streptomyces]WFB85002.1 hypothetical protein MMU79_17755 [Streptomyces olivaceus]WGK49376.1 hypothetical protein M6G09_29240 [Streptomyces sp. B146]